MTTRASKSPVTRIVSTTYEGELVAEIGPRTVVLRPLRTRKGGPAEVEVSWGLIYQRALSARAAR